MSASPVENWPDVVRDSFENDAMRLLGGESGREVLKRAWSALGDFLEAKSEMPLAVTHGNLMALVLHSVDSKFGFDGWQSLSNPDVYLLHEDRAGQRSFERIGSD
ncbi:MAG: histidine phosphatase family protein [Gammaproteobacteria bacterium]|nr:histidine phosphatase family protein [Gammaproteobacteria bacterium]